MSDDHGQKSQQLSYLNIGMIPIPAHCRSSYFYSTAKKWQERMPAFIFTALAASVDPGTAG
jgi:hypothetical protein